jgi:hypothetical protein
MTTKREHLQQSHVARKVLPGRPGTKRLMKIHGDSLVCVRYRHDPMKLYRFTTIELVIDAAPIHRKRFDTASFGVRIERQEQELRMAAKAAGARWDAMDRLWWMRGSVILTLGLIHRISKT